MQSDQPKSQDHEGPVTDKVVRAAACYNGVCTHAEVYVRLLTHPSTCQVPLESLTICLPARPHPHLPVCPQGCTGAFTFPCMLIYKPSYMTRYGISGLTVTNNWM